MLFMVVMAQDAPDEEQFFETLFYQYKKLMYAVAFDILHHKEDAEDAVQNALLQLAMHFPQKALREGGEKYARNVMAMTARNQAIDIYRKNVGKRASEQSLESLDPNWEERVTNSLQNPVEEARERHQTYERILEEMRQLPEIYRDVLYMNLVMEQTPKEIAFALSLPIKTVQKRMERGRTMLWERMKNREDYDGDE